jgi:hypothetical protein
MKTRWNRLRLVLLVDHDDRTRFFNARFRLLLFSSTAVAYFQTVMRILLGAAATRGEPLDEVLVEENGWNKSIKSCLEWPGDGSAWRSFREALDDRTARRSEATPRSLPPFLPRPSLSRQKVEKPNPSLARSSPSASSLSHAHPSPALYISIPTAGTPIESPTRVVVGAVRSS